ncbi:hypothetical protein W97_09247 [Coniosporium apollinis CBS 100218]|uniref:FHA domain-containing protein n=1 Tax=Coniosporium apollinis (strain CBS 100218) TaxID=1168221 RepID=R7Z745_CONA1|nr:uncharacterized protein W97_09247 [Coniosporium apollinis CBS 100218]EON69982.1 hypothetical protein W97_09247 [Coniosporium apollinis CBS 100218]
MTRNRAETAAPLLTVRNGADMGSSLDGQAESSERPPPPSIRFIPHHDPRASRPSLVFPTISRTLPNGDAVIRVGRYSERDNAPEIPPNTPSAAPVGFKSKVVSRRHCEFWCSNSQWYIKDVKSSSGTFLNHIRLSQPGVESQPYPVKDGDVVQLGIDFRGGEEMIFRCVKIRIECNRGWQQRLNTFNKSTHDQIRALAKGGRKDRSSDTSSTHSSECAICLNSIAPCQSLFVAPCSHVWHYKCIRPVLTGSSWPHFLCPNCRAVADLEADVEEYDLEEEEFEERVEAMIEQSRRESEGGQLTPRASQAPLTNGRVQSPNTEVDTSIMDLEEQMNGVSLRDHDADDLTSENGSVTVQPPLESFSTSRPISIGSLGNALELQHVRSGVELPMTPRNEAGPFVFDGSAGRGRREMALDADDEDAYPTVNG